jgi:predicted acyltransferase
MSSVNSPAPKPRLASLDALRGFDMLWLVGGGPLLLKLCAWLAPEPVTALVRLQTSHAPFGTGPLRAHDLVMPLFLFMAGVAMAFSGPWADDAARPDAGRWLKVVRRTGILWLLGMAVQGNLFSYEPARFIFYSNTLQAIAARGLIAELVALLPAGRARLAAFVALPCAYWALTAALGGGYAHDTNPALALDDRLLGLDRGDRDYAWILPSLNFGFTVLTGVYAGRWLRSMAAPLRKTALLATAGVAALALSAALAPWEPVNKQLWTGTFCLWSGGWSLLLLAGFYGVVD